MQIVTENNENDSGVAITGEQGICHMCFVSYRLTIIATSNNDANNNEASNDGMNASQGQGVSISPASLSGKNC